MAHWFSRPRPLHSGLAAALLAALVLLVLPPDLLDGQRELFFDRLTQLGPDQTSPDIVVVDIDRAANLAAKDGIWDRSETAEMVAKIAQAKPAALAFDLVFSRDCDPARPGNAALAEAIKAAPSILGFLISETSIDKPFPIPPLSFSRAIKVPDLWFIDGAEMSCPLFEQAARSAAATFLVGDEDGRVRRVQAFSILHATPYPALALEAVRIGRGRSIPPILGGGSELWLKLFRQTIQLDEDGSLRFVASKAEAIAKRTISAGDILAGTVDPSAFKEKIIIIGSSLPNLGGLRESASMTLEPSLQIQADIATTVMNGFIPVRNDAFVFIEAGYTLLAGLAIALAATRLRPMMIAAFGAGLIMLSVALTLLIYARMGLLLDGFSISLALGFVLLVTTYMQFAHVRRIESLARQRFGQYLPKSVVARYLDNPDMLSMRGEERQVTALFTDIEGFSTLSQKMRPHELVALLDVYFAEVNALVASAGGMVDKVVGDAVHAFFNAPEDLDNHVSRAVDCGIAISRLTESMRQRPKFAAAGFGRTRVGIETGMALLGDVGAAGKLDYTAHGDSINLAARLQEANKVLGTAICVGPEAAKTCKAQLNSVGIHEIRGFGTMELFTPDVEQPKN